MYSHTIDWISVTMTSEDAKGFGLKAWIGTPVPSTQTKGKHGYNRRVNYDTGAIRMFSTEREDMGHHFSFGGSALIQIWERFGVSPYDVLLSCFDYNGRVSRLDFAIDVRDEKLDPAALYEMPNIRTKGRGRLPKHHLRLSPDGGAQLEIGARESSKFLRIYNKAAEMGLKNTLWTRIELELKEEMAHSVGWRAAYLSELDFFRLCSGIVRDFCMFENQVYSNALTDAGAHFDVPKADRRDTLGWLIKSVAPAIARLVMENPNKDIWGDFCSEIEKIIEKEVSKGG